DLVWATAAGRALAVYPIEAVHHVHALHHSAERREPHAIEPAVVAVVDEELGGPRPGTGRREAHRAARIVLPHRVVRNRGIAPGRGHLWITMDAELRHESRDHAEESHAIEVAAPHEVVEPVRAERCPVALDLDHDVALARFQAGPERRGGPLPQGGARRVREGRLVGRDRVGGTRSLAALASGDEGQGHVWDWSPGVVRHRGSLG